MCSVGRERLGWVEFISEVTQGSALGSVLLIFSAMVLLEKVWVC